MHCTYHFFKQLLIELQPRLINTVISDCFSQHKNELILFFEDKDGTPFYLICNVTSGFNAISARADYKKAKTKFQNYFKSIVGKQVSKIKLIENDRTFYFLLSDGSKFIFKMHGNRSNLILLNKDDSVEQLFVPKLKNDQTFKLEEKINSNYENLDKLPNNVIPTLGKEINNYFLEQGWENWTETERIRELENYLQKIETKPLYLLTNEKKPSLLVNPFTGIESAIDASNELYYLLSKHHNFTEPRRQAITSIHKQIRQTQAYLKKIELQIEKFNTEVSFKEKADVLMANLHVVSQHEKEYTLSNFYGGKNIVLSLKKNEKPQDLASKWYKKDKNRHLEKNKISENKKEKEKLLDVLYQKIEKLNNCTSTKELNKLLNSTLTSTKKNVSLFKETSFGGYDIFIGRNSKNNDELLKFAKKDDLWLHAKDVPGSHVLIKSGKETVPFFVIEHAAKLAAYYSKRKTDSICPVIYTPKKYVRKKKGLLPGQVMVEREKVVLVEPASLNQD